MKRNLKKIIGTALAASLVMSSFAMQARAEEVGNGDIEESSLENEIALEEMDASIATEDSSENSEDLPTETEEGMLIEIGDTSADNAETVDYEYEATVDEDGNVVDITPITDEPVWIGDEEQFEDKVTKLAN